MPTTILKTRNGRLDGTDQAGFAILAAKVKGGAPLHLHLHGGLVDEATGLSIAERLSGPAPSGLGLPDAWEQAYVVWRTGAFETLRTNWTDLFENDRLYRTLLRKILSHASGYLDLPVPEGRTTAAGVLSEAEVSRRLAARPSTDPFADLDETAALTPGRSVSAATLDEDEAARQAEIAFEDDPELNDIADDLAAALVFDPPTGRSLSVSGDANEGLRMLAHLDSPVRAELVTQAPGLDQAAEARGFTGLGIMAKVIGRLAKIVWRVVRRFRTRRDHGFYATVVEELARELYGDLVGASIWGMMKRDAVDHFRSGGLGESLLELVEAAPSVTITAHSAGSIWAAELIARLDPAKAASVRLVLLAPAVRSDLFAGAIRKGGNRLAAVRMFTMSDDLERKDAVLGAKWSYVYPSSLLYLVSGLFEDAETEAFPDAPLLGLQRFHGPDTAWVGDAAQIAALKSTADFLAGHPSAIVYSRTSGGAGLNTQATSHGAFDQDPDTLASARHFLNP